MGKESITFFKQKRYKLCGEAQSYSFSSWWREVVDISNFDRLLSVAPAVGYFVGLGDRHNNNILIDEQTAELVHIDLGSIHSHFSHLYKQKKLDLWKLMLCKQWMNGSVIKQHEYRPHRRAVLHQEIRVHTGFKQLIIILWVFWDIWCLFRAGVAFEQGKILPTPETVPFRLTRDIVDGMGITGVEGVFRRWAGNRDEVGIVWRQEISHQICINQD